MQPKFFADENIALAVSKELKRRGVDIISVREANMSGKSDKDILVFALKEKRTIVTHDSDFLSIIQGQTHCGVLFLTTQVSIGTAIAELEKIHLVFSAEDLKNIVLFLPLKQ